MRLTDAKVKNTKPGEKPFKLFDEDGLFLLVTPTGSKWWRLKYRFGGKEKQLSLGVYPDVSLTEARTRRDTFRAMLTDRVDPSEYVKAEKAAQRAEENRQIASIRFMLDNDGALSFRLGNRRLILNPDETVELRTFLDATRAITTKVHEDQISWEYQRIKPQNAPVGYLPSALGIKASTNWLGATLGAT
jgi:hypothetical protein